MKHKLRRALLAGLVGTALAAGSLTLAAPANAAVSGGTAGVQFGADVAVKAGETRTTQWQWDAYSNVADHLHRDSRFEVYFPTPLIDFDTPKFKVWDNKQPNVDLTGSFTAKKKNGDTWTIAVKDDRQVSLAASQWREFRISVTYTVKPLAWLGQTGQLTSYALLGGASQGGVTSMTPTHSSKDGHARAYLKVTGIAPAGITARAIDEAKRQGAAQNYTAPLHKPEWKVLFYILTDVTQKDGRRSTLDEDDLKYLHEVTAPNFKQAIEDVAPVTITPTVKVDTVHVRNDSDNHSVKRSVVEDRLVRVAAPGEYDSVIVMSKYIGGPAYGLAWADGPSGALKTAYAWAGMEKRDHRINHPEARYDPTTNNAVHEFMHQLHYLGSAYPFPDLHNAGGLGYAYSEADGFMDFHQDFMTGKVVVNGKKIGQYPRMWATSPRFFNKPGMVTVRYVNAAGQSIAADDNTYGPGGDRYALTARQIDGRSAIRVKSGSLTGTFGNGTVTEITLEYPSSAKPLTIFDTGEKDQKHVVSRKSGESFRDYALYRSSDAISAATYTVTGSGTGMSLDGTFRDAPLSWKNDRATVTSDGNTYTLTKTGENSVRVEVAFASPQKDRIRLDAPGYKNSAATARGSVVWDVRSIVPAGAGAGSWDIATEPVVSRVVTWGAYTTPVTLSETGTADEILRPVLRPGDWFRDQAIYAIGEAITAASYTVTGNNTDARMEDVFAGQPVVWSAGGKASFAARGNTYTLTRLSASSVRVDVTFGSPRIGGFLFDGPQFGTAGSGVQTSVAWDILSVTPASTEKAENISGEPRALRLVTWGDAPVQLQIFDTGLKDQTRADSVTTGTRWSDYALYKTSEPVTAMSYVVRASSGATHDGGFLGTQVNWSGDRTIHKNGNVYTLTRLDANAIRIDVTFGSPQKDRIPLDGPTFVGTSSTITWDVLSVTKADGTTQQSWIEPTVSRVVTWK